MGLEIQKSQFTADDFNKFQKRLQAETKLLGRWVKERRFDSRSRSIGLELETCLVNKNFLPAPENEKFLKKIHSPWVVAELSQFNAEINTPSQTLGGDCLKKIHEDLKKTWKHVQKVSAELNLKMLMIGCLPTLTDKMLTLKYMSNLDRFRALNEQIMLLRKGQAVRIHIQGYETLDVTHRDMVLEAAATSMQIHLQVEAPKMKRYFNASIIASAPMVALSANAPFLFGKSLWEETRIPLFEQAVNLAEFGGEKILPRVAFGSGYVRKNLHELFRENLTLPVLLPLNFNEKKNFFSHIRLHNGTIWRWNRPVLGMDPKVKPHLRVEHRVCSAGPTLIDIVANVAFYLGLVHSLASQKLPPEKKLPFEVARKNFYSAARWGLAASVDGLHSKERNLQTLILKHFLPLAKKGLQDLKIAPEDIRLYLDEVIYPRVKTAQTGSFWQRSFIHKHGPDFQLLTKEYFKFQEKDLPVHEWKL
jgi:gamma-glutamyl:cysteine ligase YbdK (ATP-grasp superfamily)